MRTPIFVIAAAALPRFATAEPAADPVQLSLGGYVELFYQAHLQRPSNHLTNLRGFDNRSETFTLSTVALDAKGEKGPIATRVVLQLGHTPSTYYLAEPASAGSGSAAASSGEVWKYLQVATLTAKLPSDWLLEAGLAPSPIGLEVLPIKDNRQWSRSNLFFGLPAYHTGVTLSHPVADGWSAKVHVYNGWNSVVDNNSYPSVALSASHTGDRTTAQLLYFGGIERPRGATEGRAWRHLIDALVQHSLTDSLIVAAQIDAGIEPNDLGTSAWAAGALYGTVVLSPELYLAARADYFAEKVPTGASSIFWPTPWLASGTVTLAYQPVTGVSTRLEYRHDHADTDVFFGGTVAIDPASMAFVPNRRAQDTITLGVTSWF